MYRTKNAMVASSLAAKHGLCWGMSVFDGFYYVGTDAQLANVGVVVGKGAKCPN